MGGGVILTLGSLLLLQDYSHYDSIDGPIVHLKRYFVTCGPECGPMLQQGHSFVIVGIDLAHVAV